MGSSLFKTNTRTQLPPKVRGLTAALAAEANDAVADGLVRTGDNTEEVVDAIESMRRYLSPKGWTIKVSYDGNEISWQAVEKRERPPMTEEHKAKLVAAAAAARAAKAARATEENTEEALEAAVEEALEGMTEEVTEETPTPRGRK